MKFQFGVIIATAMFAFASQSPANAIPVQLNPIEYAVGTAGLTVTLEDFNGYALGPHAAPFVTANGTYNSDAPSISQGVMCPYENNNCLSNQNIEGERIFSGFLPDTAYWAAALGYYRETDLVDIVVTGNSGVLNFTGIEISSFLFDFFAVHDPLGLISISFINNGTQNPDGSTDTGSYGFDNILTASAAPPVVVAEPASFTLLAFGLAGFALSRRRQGVSRARPLQKRSHGSNFRA